MAGSSLIVALVANFTIGIMKLFVGILTGSQAMISEAYHSFADTFNQVLLFLGIRKSKQSPDLEHPFGYQKNQFFWSFVVAILIFGLSGTLALIEGIEIIINPEDHKLKRDLFIWNILVLAIAIVLESIALRQAYREAKAYQENSGIDSIMEAVDEMQDPVLLSLLVEDSLALTGLIVALIGVSLTFIINDPIIDGYTSLVIGIILIVGGLLLAKENKTYLIGIAVTSRTQEQISQIVKDHESVKELLNMKTMLLGPKDMILTLEIDFIDKAELGRVAEAIDKIEGLLIEAIPYLKANKIFIEAG